MSKVATYLWFDSQAEEAALLYTSIVENSQVTNVSRGHDGAVAMVSFELDGQKFLALNGGPHFTFSEATSIFVSCESQEQVDDLWDRLTANGGEEGPCGWLKDPYGLSWQIIPTVLVQLLSDPDPERAGKAATAMRTMKKIDIKGLLDAV
jgi:predicted 3-demethylubiquinone-9 3-methyltransferase (glyoxalase superfamily)